MKRVFLFCAGLFLAVSLAFGSGTQPQEENPSAALTGPGGWNYKYPAPASVTVGRTSEMMNYLDGENFENNIYTRWIKDVWNIEIKIGFLSAGADYTQRVTLAIASGDLPDIMTVLNRQQLVELIESGMAEDLTGLYDKWASPLFKAAIDTYGGLENAMPTTFLNGRQYAASMVASGGQDALFWVREDWRLKLGFSEPKTIDDFVKLAQAFADNDMAGSRLTTGIEITSPVAGAYNASMRADPFFAEAGAYPRLWVDDARGKITYGSITTQAKEGLRTLRDLYAKGILARDWLTRDHRAALAAGHIGMVIGPWWIPDTDLGLTVNNNPGAVWRPYTWTSTKTGKRHTFQPNSNYGWHIIRKGYTHPEMATRFQNITAEVRCYYDGPTLTPEEENQWQTIIPANVRNAYAGRQRINWTSWPSTLPISFNDMIPRLAAQEKANYEKFKAGNTAGMDAATRETLGNIVKWENGSDKSYAPWNNHSRYTAKQFSLTDANTIDVKKTYWPYNTDTMRLRWANLETLENLAYANIIMGIEPLDHFETFVRNWLSQGGQTILEEVNRQFGK